MTAPFKFEDRVVLSKNGKPDFYCTVVSYDSEKKTYVLARASYGDASIYTNVPAINVRELTESDKTFNRTYMTKYHIVQDMSSLSKAYPPTSGFGGEFSFGAAPSTSGFDFGAPIRPSGSGFGFGAAPSTSGSGFGFGAAPEDKKSQDEDKAGTKRTRLGW